MNLAGFGIFSDSFVSATQILASGTLDVWNIILTSLRVSSVAVALSLVVGVPVGFWLGTRRSVSRATALVFANAGMGLPPVVVGLFVSMLLSRRGPLGDWGLLYSQTAMIIAQVIISLPIVVAITASGVSAVPGELRLQARSLGASIKNELVLTMRESSMAIFAAVAAGFGSIISEVGAVQMVGGNLAGETRVMTTAIVQYTRMGRYPEAVALAIILLAIIVAVNVLITSMQTRGERHTKEVK